MNGPHHKIVHYSRSADSSSAVQSHVLLRVEKKMVRTLEEGGGERGMKKKTIIVQKKGNVENCN